jgi:hypothetical protein
MISSFLCGPTNCICSDDVHYKNNDENGDNILVPIRKVNLKIGKINGKKDITSFTQNDDNYKNDSFNFENKVSKDLNIL